MNYRELQIALSTHKENGLTDIALNSKKTVLQAELDRVEDTALRDRVAAAEADRIQSLFPTKTEELIENNSIDIDHKLAIPSFFVEAQQTMPESVALYSNGEKEIKVNDTNTLSSTKLTEPNQNTKSIFPATPTEGLIRKTIHLIQCTYILIKYYMGLYFPNIVESKVEIARQPDKSQTYSIPTYQGDEETSDILSNQSKSIFPPTPDGLINGTVHLGICTYILLEHLLFSKPRIPVIYMAGTYKGNQPSY